LWGVAGMFFGVPAFACIYTAVRYYSAYRLRKRGLPTETEHYASHKPVWPEEVASSQEESGGDTT